MSIPPRARAGPAHRLRSGRGISLRVGVIGTGILGAKHARLIAEETAGASVCDLDPRRSARPTGVQPHVGRRNRALLIAEEAPDAARTWVSISIEGDHT